MKRIPDSFDCMNRTWDVKHVAHGTLVDEEGTPVYGLTDFENAWIILEDGHPPRFAYEVFWHEMGHVVEDALGIPIDEHDEAKMDMFGRIMGQIMRTQQ